MYDLLWVRGPDAVSFLQGLVSQDVEAMPHGSVARSFLLGPQGKLTALLWLLRGDEKVGIVTDAGYGEEAATTLRRYKIRIKAEITLEDRPLAVIIEDRTGEGWTDDGVLRASLPLGRAPRTLIAGEAGPDIDLTALRVEEGEPVMGQDVDHKTIPQETGLTGQAVSFTKGCYLGQELVARIDTRGHVNRNLRGVVIDGETVPAAGAQLVAGDKVVGVLTSPVYSERLAAPIGLSLVRREVEPGETVEVRWDGGSSTAEVRELPL